MGTIVSLQLCPGYRKPMSTVSEAEAMENLGLINDKHAMPDSSRQVLLIEKETLDALHLSPGQVKENITTSGVRLMSLRMKDRLQLGKDVVLEITNACSPCSRMDELRPGLIKELAGKRGMLARVLKGGKVSVGDRVEIVKAAHI